jgi:predicted nucleic acid-binding protein
MVADSSLVVQGLLTGQAEFEADRFLVPELVIHEVSNALFVQHRILHRIPDGLPYLKRLFDAIASDSLILVPSSRELALETYEIASRTGATVYDCVFIALALQYGMQLRTLDDKQAQIFEVEKSRHRTVEPAGTEAETRHD